MCCSGSGAGAAAVRVRTARREDMALVARLIKDLATVEGEPDAPRLTAEDLIRDGFDCEQPWFSVLLAEVEGGGAEVEGGGAKVEGGGAEVAGGGAQAAGGGAEVAGYALVTRAYSSCSGRALYVEDVFVRERWRRRGVATSLFVHLAQMCVAEGRTRMDWHVLRENPGARALYARLGARELFAAERRDHMRLYPERIRELAAGRLLPRAHTVQQNQQ